MSIAPAGGTAALASPPKDGADVSHSADAGAPPRIEAGEDGRSVG